MQDYYKHFNSTCCDLVRMLIDKDKSIHSYRLKERVILLVKTEPLFLLEVAGPYVWEYRDYVNNKKIHELINKDFSNIEGYKEEDDIIVNIVKGLYAKSDDDERETIYEMVEQLLSEYARYLHDQKVLNKLKDITL